MKTIAKIFMSLLILVLVVGGVCWFTKVTKQDNPSTISVTISGPSGTVERTTVLDD